MMFRLLLLLFIGGLHLDSLAQESADSSTVLSTYHVITNVNSRLAFTSITMVFENPNEDCSDLHSLTLQLPRNARLTDLLMDLSDGCQLNSIVKSLDTAVDDFNQASSQGRPAALLTAWDMANYNLKVSIPPNGTTSVLLKYQELLWKNLDQIRFQVPLFPGTKVGELQVDISVEDNKAGIVEFQTLDLKGVQTNFGNNISSAHYESFQVSKDSSLPSLLQAYYRPGILPEEGLLFSDGECFTHLFNPSTFLSIVGSMARKIVFVIDISGSMSGQKLVDAKASFAAMIETLDERDTLIVQPFSDQGTEALWGPTAATSDSKVQATNFVMELETIGGTNLNQAFLDGIANIYEVPAEIAPILVILTDGQGNIGPKDTARNVLAANEGGRVKIFSLAFGFDADMDLLLGIAIQNGGRAVRIYEGFGDAVTQMELFYKQELGTIMLSDIDVSYDFGDIRVSESTIPEFPVLALGSEIVVRGKVDYRIPLNTVLKSTVSANSAIGVKQWSAEYAVIEEETTISDCRSSFAQARIVELLEYRNAERALGDELFIGTGASRQRRSGTTSSFEDQAQQLALDAHLLWPGLTALVTFENTSCQQNTYDVCYSGEDDVEYDVDEGAEESGGKMNTKGNVSGAVKSEWILPLTCSILASIVFVGSFI